MTKAEARKAVRWFQRRMGITDWTIAIDFQDAPPWWVEVDPRDVAAMRENVCSKRARVWISETRAKEDEDESILRCLFHECLHVVEYDVRLPTPTAKEVDYMWDQLAAICETAYLAETKGKR